jgi:hypothetical protein
MGDSPMGALWFIALQAGSPYGHHEYTYSGLWAPMGDDPMEALWVMALQARSPYGYL